MEHSHKINIHDGNFTEETLTSYVAVITDNKTNNLKEHMHMINNGANGIRPTWTTILKEQRTDPENHMHIVDLDKGLKHTQQLNNNHSHEHYISFGYYGRG